MIDTRHDTMPRSWNDLWQTPTPTGRYTPPTTSSSADSGHRQAYIDAALSREAATVAAAPTGTRNDTLNTAAFSLGQLSHHPELPEDRVRAELAAAAAAAGLTPTETTRTITSGLRAGQQQPRTIPEPDAPQVGVLDLDQLDTDLVDADTGEVTSFWDARPVLAHIRAFALARMTAPWAVLGGCLLRALAAVPPHVVLPPTVGGVGSLNLLVGLVGPSGAGKGASEATAADAIGWPAIHTAPLGSGEGITHAYARPKTRRETDADPADPDPLAWEHRSVLFSAAEVDQVAAISSRRGSTLMTQLRSAYSGERLGMQYVDATKRIILPAHQYRFGLSVGIQPGRATAILDEADGGTPQRFLWLPVTDPAITADPPPEPETWRWAKPIPAANRIDGARTDTQGRTVLPIPDQVTHTIRAAHAARARGEGDALDGHALYTRLKVAAGLAALDQRLDVRAEDWELAGAVMAVSDLTRARVQAQLATQAAQADTARARRDAHRQAITEETLAEEGAQRVARNVARVVEDAGTVARSKVRKTLASRDRGLFDDALNRLVEAGQITVVQAGNGEDLKWVA